MGMAVGMIVVMPTRAEAEPVEDFRNHAQITPLQIFADGLKLLDRPTPFAILHGVFQAMVDVVMHQSPLGLSDSLLDRVELLGDV
jgi:hypothetical protein